MSFEGLLGEGSAARQLLVYGVGYEIARSLLGPMFTQIEYLINNNDPLIELSPAELADLVIRGVIGNEPDAASRAQKFGIDASKFHELVTLAGEPPGLIQVLEWWRRGYLPFDQGIGAPSVAEAIRTSRLYPYWTDVIKLAQFAPPGPADAIDAVQRNQITLDQGIALAFYAGLGVSSLTVPAGSDTSQTATAFQVLLNTRGNPPSLTELLELARRGIIPWGNLDPNAKSPNPQEISFAQGIYEGDTKDKWLPYFARLAEYHPPPRTIITLLKDGTLTPAQATTLLTEAGLTPDLVAAYVASATVLKTAAPKALSESQIVTLFTDKLIDQPTATADLALLGYNAAEAAQILTTAESEQVLTDYRRNQQRIGTYFIAKKIDAQTATSELAALGTPADQIARLLAGWTIDRQANVRILTAAQVTQAFQYGIFTEDQAMATLEADGYTPYDAWVILSIKNKGPLPNPPLPGPGPIQ